MNKNFSFWLYGQCHVLVGVIESEQFSQLSNEVVSNSIKDSIMAGLENHMKAKIPPNGDCELERPIIGYPLDENGIYILHGFKVLPDCFIYKVAWNKK